MCELYVQNCNDTNCTSDREAVLQEEKQLYENIIEIANNTTFNRRLSSLFQNFVQNWELFRIA